MKPKRAKPPAAAVSSLALTRKPEALALAQAFGVRSLHRRVTADEVGRIRALAMNKNETLSILVSLLWTTGARISETLEVRVSDINFAGSYVTIQTLKTRSKRLVSRGVPLPPMMLGELAVYINSRGRAPTDRLVPWRRTKAWKEIHQVMLEAGVEESRAFPHAFRHGHALHALAAGVPLTILQQTLGHSSVLTTQHYARATGADIAFAYKGVSWL